MTQIVEITERFGDAYGPLENVLVTAELVSGGMPLRTGMAAPARYSARTDADGEVLLVLPPNTLPGDQSWYVFNAWHPNTGDKLLDNVVGVVPGYSVTLTDILSRNPNPVSRAVKSAETALTRSAHDVAMALVADMPDSYAKRQMKAQLAVVNLRIWPYSQQKLTDAAALVGLLMTGATKTQLMAQISDFSPVVIAYHAANIAAHSRLRTDINAAQAALNAAPYGDAFDMARANIQALIESTVVTARFATQPLMSDQNDVAELIAGAHPYLSADGLSVRNPGQNVFGFISDVSVQPGSGWHVVEFDIADGYTLESFIGVGDKPAIQASVGGLFGAGAVFVGTDIR